jgi:hypothetical protein
MSPGDKDSKAVVFEYDAFPPVPEAESEGSELRQAALLAQVLADSLAAGNSVTPGEPIQEDFGAVLPVSTRAGTAFVIISFCPRDGSDLTWAVQFREAKGFLRTLFARRQDDRILGPVREAVGKVLAGQPAVYRKVEWRGADELR